MFLEGFYKKPLRDPLYLKKSFSGLNQIYYFKNSTLWLVKLTKSEVLLVICGSFDELDFCFLF